MTEISILISDAMLLCSLDKWMAFAHGYVMFVVLSDDSVKITALPYTVLNQERRKYICCCIKHSQIH